MVGEERTCVKRRVTGPTTACASPVAAAVLSTSAAGVYSIPVALAGSLLLLSRSLLTATYHSIMTAPPNEVAARLSAALRHSVIVVLVGGALSVPVVAVG